MQFTIPNQVHIGSFGLEERQKCLYAAERLWCAHKKRGLRGNCGLGMAKSAQKSCSACQKWLLTTKNARKQGERVRLEGRRRKRSAGLAKRFLDFARNDKQSARNDKQKLAIPLSPLSDGRSYARWGRSGRLRRRLRERRWDIRRYCRTFRLRLQEAPLPGR